MQQARAMSTVLGHRRKAFTDSWSPIALGAQLEAWFKADSIVGLSDGSSLSSWSDSGPNGRHITYGATKPTFKQSQQNGKPAVEFPGSTLSKPSFAGTLFSGSLSVSGCYVFKSLSSQTGAVLCTRDSTSGYINHEPWSDGNIYTSFGRTDRVAVSGAPSLTSQFRIGSIRASSSWKYGVDGTTCFSGPATFSNPASRFFGIGYQDDPAYSWYGLLCEVVLTNSNPSDADAQRVEGYLAWKYGLQGSIPANHPYKLKAP